MYDSEEHPENALYPIDITLEGRLIEDNEVH